MYDLLNRYKHKGVILIQGYGLRFLLNKGFKGYGLGFLLIKRFKGFTIYADRRVKQQPTKYP